VPGSPSQMAWVKDETGP